MIGGVHKHRGFALLVALLTLSIVGVAMLTLAAATSADGRRTLQQMRDEQLRQMLLAGAADVAARLKSAAPDAGNAWSVELPENLLADAATLKISVTSNTARQLTLSVDAALSGSSARQMITFKRQDDNSWKLANAQLD